MMQKLKSIFPLAHRKLLSSLNHLHNVRIYKVGGENAKKISKK